MKLVFIAAVLAVHSISFVHAASNDDGGGVNVGAVAGGIVAALIVVGIIYRLITRRCSGNGFTPESSNVSFHPIQHVTSYAPLEIPQKVVEVSAVQAHMEFEGVAKPSTDIVGLLGVQPKVVKPVTANYVNPINSSAATSSSSSSMSAFVPQLRASETNLSVSVHMSPPTPPPVVSGNLPAPWIQVLDPNSGKMFYFNPQTNTSSWTMPTA